MSSAKYNSLGAVFPPVSFRKMELIRTKDYSTLNKPHCISFWFPTLQASGMWDGGHVEDQSPRLEYLNLEQPNLPVDLRGDMTCGGSGVRPKTFMPRYNR